ncbi:MAG: hypothetical protein AAGD12_08450 [Pseudomonadota bacterium]
MELDPGVVIEGVFFSGGYKPMIPFAEIMRRETGIDQFVVDAAYGGTSLSPRDGVDPTQNWHPTTPGGLWERALAALGDTVASLEASGHTVSVDRVVIAQGASDAIGSLVDLYPDLYPDALQAWLSAIKGAFGDLTPIYMLQTGNTAVNGVPVHGHQAQIRAAQAAIATATPGVTLVPTDIPVDGVELVGPIHHNNAGAALYGERSAQTVLGYDPALIGARHLHRRSWRGSGSVQPGRGRRGGRSSGPVRELRRGARRCLREHRKPVWLAL